MRNELAVTTLPPDLCIGVCAVGACIATKHGENQRASVVDWIHGWALLESRRKKWYNVYEAYVGMECQLQLPF